jgi:hypothetical protein
VCSLALLLTLHLLLWLIRGAFANRIYNNARQAAETGEPSVRQGANKRAVCLCQTILQGVLLCFDFVRWPSSFLNGARRLKTVLKSKRFFQHDGLKPFRETSCRFPLKGHFGLDETTVQPLAFRSIFRSVKEGNVTQVQRSLRSFAVSVASP